jgi:hypothetical protein
MEMLRDFIKLQTQALLAQQTSFTASLQAATKAAQPMKSTKTDTSTSGGYKLNINPLLKYKAEFPSQLEGDVFFSDVDASIIASSTQGHAYFRKMLKESRQHPFYHSTSFKRAGALVMGSNFTFDHTKHDDRTIIKRISSHHPGTAKRMTHLIEKGGHLSWETKNSIVHQYYRATLSSNHLYYLTMIPENNGLALRALMKKESMSIQFNDVKLATINTSKLIRQITYNPKAGLLRYFGDLRAQLTVLSGVGMKIEKGSYAEMDLIGHVFEHLTEKNKALATKVKWIRVEVSANRYELEYERITTDLLLAERLAKAEAKDKPPQANNLQGNSLSGDRGNRNKGRNKSGTSKHHGNNGNGGGNGDRGPAKWKRDYPDSVIAALVEYAKARWNLRLKEKGLPHTAEQPKCFNCAKGNSIHRFPKKKPSNHHTRHCHSTLIRAYNGMTASNACKAHPDGCHLGSKCMSDAGHNPNPRANKASAGSFTPSTSRAEHIRIMMALPVSMREAYASALADE